MTASHIKRSSNDIQKAIISLSDFSSELLAQRKLERRAVEAAVWGMPLVSFDAMRQAFFDAGAQYGDILYFSAPADWQFQITTPNASSLYVYFHFNTRGGPVVLESPAAKGAGLFGSLNDAWQTPMVDVGPEGADSGKGGKYLLLPPDYSLDIPPGYIPVRFQTYNGYGLLRAIPASSSSQDRDKALALARSLKLHDLVASGSSPRQRFIDIAGKPFNAIAPFDARFYDGLARMVDAEPVLPRDRAMMAQLASIGIEKGKRFLPNAELREILEGAVAEAHAGFMQAVTQIHPYWPDSAWGMSIVSGPKTGFTFELPGRLDVDERAATFFLACAPPKKLGAATLYVGAFTDGAGQPLMGEASYRLRVPPDVPARQYWAATVYDLETAAFIQGASRVAVDSYDRQALKNPDGSVDVYFGPKAPKGKEHNWIFTAPGRRWFSFFRFYGPLPPVLEKKWVLPDIEKIS